MLMLMLMNPSAANSLCGDPLRLWFISHQSGRAAAAPPLYSLQSSRRAAALGLNGENENPPRLAASGALRRGTRVSATAAGTCWTIDDRQPAAFLATPSGPAPSSLLATTLLHLYPGTPACLFSGKVLMSGAESLLPPRTTRHVTASQNETLSRVPRSKLSD